MLSSASIDANEPRLFAQGKSVVFSRIRFKSRKLHNTLAWLVAVPALLIFLTGILLQMRQEIPWIQPASQKGSTPGIPQISLTAAFDQAKAVPNAQITTWADLQSIDIKPARGTIHFRGTNGFEVQVDGATGEILSAAPRRTSLLIELHQGSFFHPLVMKWIFLPAGIGIFLLWLTGAFMMIQRGKQRGKV